MRHRIAVIPGDGIGKEVLPEGIRVLDAAGRRFGFDFEWKNFDWSCETYAKTGRMMPQDGIAQLRPFKSIFRGAVGFHGAPPRPPTGPPPPCGRPPVARPPAGRPPTSTGWSCVRTTRGSPPRSAAASS